MTGRLTKDGLRGLAALIAATLIIIGSLGLAVGGVSAAATGVTWGTSSASAEFGNTVDVAVDVTADSAGISNGTLTVTTSDGTVVAEKSVSVAANSTETKMVSINTADAGPPGSYNLSAAVDGTSSGTLTLTVLQSDGANLPQESYNVSEDSQITVNATVYSGEGSNTTATPELRVMQNGSVVASITADSGEVTLQPGESRDVQFTVDPAAENVTAGDYTVKVMFGDGGSGQKTLTVADATTGGGTGGDSGGQSLPVQPRYIAAAAAILLVLAGAVLAD